jgi:hypothetical protein
MLYGNKTCFILVETRAQIFDFLSAPVSSVMEQTWLSHASLEWPGESLEIHTSSVFS